MSRTTKLPTPLHIAQATWDRLEAHDKVDMVLDAEAMGYRLIVVATDGAEALAAALLPAKTRPVRNSRA